MLPFSGLPLGVRWLGIDVDRAVCSAVERAVGGRCPGVEVRAGDARGEIAGERFDLALLLKLIPTLEQLEPGCGARVVRGVPARVVVVSFPRRTLGGRDVGMDGRSDGAIERLMGGWERLDRFDLGAERVTIARVPERG